MNATEALLEHAPPKAATPMSDYELERGKPMPSKNHGKIQARLISALFNRVGAQYDVASEVTLDLPEKSATPDLIILPKSPDDWQNDEIKLKTTPITTIEILSPSQRLSELEEKVLHYQQAGAKSCWIVIPSLRTVAVYAPNEPPRVFSDGDIKDGALGVSLSLQEIFGQRA